jgi:hypothetical protein
LLQRLRLVDTHVQEVLQTRAEFRCALLQLSPFSPMCVCCLRVDLQGLSRPGSSAGSSKKQPKQAAGATDVWTMLDMLDAANLLLWTDLVRPGECKYYCCAGGWCVCVWAAVCMMQHHMPADAAGARAVLCFLHLSSRQPRLLH